MRRHLLKTKQVPAQLPDIRQPVIGRGEAQLETQQLGQSMATKPQERRLQNVFLRH